MSHEIAAIILAAGKGTRMKSPLPKVMHPVAGKTLVNHVLTTTKALNPTMVVGVIGADMTQVEAEFSDVIPASLCVIQTEQLGTGHAVRAAEPALDDFSGIVFVLYADTPFITEDTLRKMAKRFDSSNTLAAVVLGFTTENPGSYGRLVTSGHHELDAIVEFKDATYEEQQITLCNSGVMAVRSNLLPELLAELTNDNANEEYYLTDLIEIARKKGHKCAYEECAENEVMGINSQAERAIAEDIKQQELRHEAMKEGAILIAPHTVFFSCDTQIASGAIIHPHVIFGPNVIIEEGVEIKSFSHLEGTTIRKNASAGPYARLRPGADIGESAKIGNFVEIKKSTLGTGAKVSHLSYIGDATLGDNVNVGAGTVTCNYDGYNKFQTDIAHNAFIGSNTSLIAPVKIGSGAIVAAGSTVRTDVQSDSVAYNDMKQKTNSGRAKELKKKEV